MRKAFLILISISFLITACSDTGTKKNKKKKEKEVPECTIGINLALTGNGSYFSSEVKKGMDLTFDYLKETPGKIKLDVIYEDNKMSPKDAVTITKKFIEIDKADLIVCGYSPLIQATIGMVDAAGIPMLVTLSSVEDIATPYPWAFRDFELESDNMPMMASYVHDVLNLKKGSSLVINDDTGEEVVFYFTQAFTEKGGEMIEGEVFEAAEMDLRNKINKVMAEDPQFVIVVGRGSAMINAVRQIRERDQDIPIIGNNTFDNDQVWEALGDNAENCYFPRPYIDPNNGKFKKANERFFKLHGREMNWVNIYGVSTASYIVTGLRKTAGDPEKMREFLSNLNTQSIRGMLIMNENSDVLTPHEVFERTGGKSVPAEDKISPNNNNH